MPVPLAVPPPVFRRLLLALVALILAAAAVPSLAQVPPSLLASGGKAGAAPTQADAAEAAEAERLAKLLEDPARREELIRQLRLLSQAGRTPAADRPVVRDDPSTGEAVLAQVARAADAVVRAIVDAGILAANIPGLADWLVDQFDDAESRTRWLGILTELAIVFGAAVLVELVTWWALRRPRQAIARRQAVGRVRRLPFLLLRAFLELLPVAAFVGIAYGTLALLPPDFAARFVSLTVVRAVALAGIVVALARAALMPDAPGLRLLPLGDETANYVMIWVRRFVGLGIYGFAVLDIAFLVGLPVSIYQLVERVLGLVLAGLATVFVLQNRVAVSDWLRSRSDGGPPQPRVATAFCAWLAETWHLVALVYVAMLAIVWLLQIPSGFAFVLRASALSVVVIAAGALAQAGTRRLLRRVFAVAPALAREFPNIELRANRYIAIVGIVASTAIALVVVILLLQAWGLRSLDWLSSSFGQRLTGGLVSIVVVGLLALFVWEVVDRIIERSLQRLSRQAPTAGSAVRLRTFLPLIRNVAMVVLATIFVLVALSEIGVNIAPLLAGASIIGIAVAFGANALVKDVITGLFILIEGTINIGDVVEVDGRSGVVEGLSIRTMRLRDLTGSVHTVPFSNVTSVKNMTRDFSFAVIDANVAYSTDLALAMDVLRRIEEEMRADPAFAVMISAPLEMLGVERFADSAIVVRARIRTPPGKQWSVSREFNRRMKLAFDQAGIEIPFPHQVVVGEPGLRRPDAAPPPALGQDRGPAQ
ncbi:mechanosensitive ion channel domain-containing protein [Stella sp.]|uniref:mechanosensitive ion channel domain-containing protein n=1 Tax=Stella sp. TaxID=2912054 RepID=UPI0035AEB8B1